MTKPETLADAEAEKRVYEAKLRIVTDRDERWAYFYRRRNRLDGPGGMSILAKLGAEAAEQRRRKKRSDPNPWFCADCDQSHLQRPQRCRRCGRGVFYRLGRGVAGKQVHACTIHGTGSRNWREEMATDDCIRAMPHDLRRVLKINFLSWCGQQEKADEIGVSAATFRSRLAMAYHYQIGYGDGRGWFDVDNR